MSQLKTLKNDSNVEEFINSLDNERSKKDCFKLLDIFEEVTREKPAMWGTSIIGYGTYHYKSERSSQEGDWPMIAFSPRKQNLTIYIMPGFRAYKTELERLGKHKTSVSCLYIKKLEDVDLKVLKKIISKSYLAMKKKYANG